MIKLKLLPNHEGDLPCLSDIQVLLATLTLNGLFNTYLEGDKIVITPQDNA